MKNSIEGFWIILVLMCIGTGFLFELSINRVSFERYENAIEKFEADDHGREADVIQVLLKKMWATRGFIRILAWCFVLVDALLLFHIIGLKKQMSLPKSPN